MSYLTITAFVLLVLEIPLGLSFARNEQERLQTHIERDARVLATLVEDTLHEDAPLDNTVIKDYQSNSGGRVLVTDAQGISIADSDGTVGRSYATRTEVATALTGQVATGERFSKTLKKDLTYVAVPVASGGTVYGVVRITFPSSEVNARARSYWLILASLAVVVLGTVTLVGFIIARSVTRPVKALALASHAFASGDLSARAPTSNGPPELRGLGVSFNQMTHRIEELVQAQQAFVADASHQLRTPLTALRLRLENLEESVDPEIKGEVDAAIAETVRLATLVNQLLHLARTESTGGETAETIDLVAAIKDRQETWAPLADENGVELKIDCPARASVSLTPGAIEQILDNLLANAIEVAPQGTNISIRLVNSVDAVQIHVIDEGPGMNAEQRQWAFNRFWRGAGTTGPDGSGLGLAIVAQLSEVNGGQAGLSPGPNGGLDAWVRFPIS